MTETDDLPTTGSPTTRRQALAWAGLGAAATGLLAACGKSSSSGDTSSGVGNFPSTPTWNFVFVNHVTTNPFFQPTQYAIQDACAIFKCKYQWTGSETASVSEMVNAMSAAISAKADGIAVAIVDTNAFNEPTTRALAAGIPVVSYNADATGNSRLAYVGQDLYLSGFEMGKRIVELIPSGKVALFIATPGSLNIQPRIDGAMAAIKQSGKPVQATAIATGADLNGELSRIDSYYQGNKDVKGMFAVDAGSTQGVGQVMQKYGLQAKGLHGGGYDLLPQTLKLVSSGDLDFTIDQEAYLQGFLPVTLLYLYKLSGTLLGPPETNTGLKFVTKDNVAPYLTSTNRYEGSTAAQKYLKS